MRRDHLVYAGVGAIGLTLVAFVLLGFGRLVLGWRGALWLAAVPATVAILLTIVGFVRSLAHLTGIWPLADPPDGDGTGESPDDDLWE